MLKNTQASHDILTRGSSDARDLKELLSAMVENMLQTTQVVATSQEYALKIVTEQVSDEAQHIMTALAATLASTASLHHEIVSYLPIKPPNKANLIRRPLD